MTAVPLSVGLIAVAIAILLRALPRIVWPRYQGTDAFYHLAYIRLIRETGHRLPTQNPRIVGPGVHAYPALFHWALSFLSPRLVRSADRFGGLVGDIVVAGATSGFLYAHGAVDTGTAFVAAALYLLLPGLILPHIGPRAFTLTPRVWGQAFYALAAVSWMMADSQPAMWFVSVLPLALMLLTSKFAVQNLVFVTPIAALLLSRYEPLAASGAAAVLALLLFRAMFVRQLVGQVGHLKWYLRYNQGMVAHRNNWHALRESVRTANVRRLAVETLWHNPILSGLIRHFPLMIALVLAWHAGFGADVTVTFALTLAALVPWIITPFGRARVLGESERYLEFAAPAAWVLLWTAHPSALVLGVIAVAALIAYAATLLFIARTQGTLAEVDEADVAQILGGKPEAVLLCLHDPESYYFLAATDVRLVKYNGDLTAFGASGNFVARLFWRYPYVDPDALHDLIRENGVTIILENRRARDRFKELAGRDYDLAGLSEMHRNRSYVLYSAGSTT
jgi:hypothetical protein